MRIALLTSHYLPVEGGIQTHISDLSKLLADRGHEVIIITNNTHNLNRLQVINKKIIIFRANVNFKISNALISFDLLKFLISNKFDLIHIHLMFHWGSEIGFIKSVSSKIPVIVTIHNFQGNKSFLAFLYDNLLLRYQLKRSTVIITTTKSFKNMIWKSIGKKSIIIPMAIPAHFINYENHKPFQYKDYLLFVGNLNHDHHYKGIDNLIYSFSKIIYKYKNINLLIVGSGDQSEKLKKLAISQGIRDRVIFLGHIDNLDLPILYKNAIGTILPSTHAESFGMVLIESLACNTPVLTTNLPGIKDVIQNYGLIVQPNSIESLKNGIISLIESSKEIREKEPRKFVEKYYSWENTINKIEKIYKLSIENKNLGKRIF